MSEQSHRPHPADAWVAALSKGKHQPALRHLARGGNHPGAASGALAGAQVGTLGAEQGVIDAQIAEVQRKIAALRLLPDEAKKQRDDLIRAIDENQDHFDSAATTADGLAAILTLFVSLGGIVKSAQKAAAVDAKLFPKEAVKLNAEVLKGGLGIPRDGFLTGIAKTVSNLRGSKNKLLIALGSLAEGFDRITSPSYWVGVAGRAHDGTRKGFVEVMAGSATSEFDALKKQAEDLYSSQLQVLAGTMDRLLALLRKLQEQKQGLGAGSKPHH